MLSEVYMRAIQREVSRFQQEQQQIEAENETKTEIENVGKVAEIKLRISQIYQSAIGKEVDRKIEQEE